MGKTKHKVKFQIYVFIKCLEPLRRARLKSKMVIINFCSGNLLEWFNPPIYLQKKNEIMFRIMILMQFNIFAILIFCGSEWMPHRLLKHFDVFQWTCAVHMQCSLFSPVLFSFNHGCIGFRSILNFARTTEVKEKIQFLIIKC